MTKRDFFKIIIKLVILYVFITFILSVFSTIISYLYQDGQYYSNMSINDVFIPGINFILLILLLFFEDVIISFLHLDKGFDDDKIAIGNLDTEKWTQFVIVFLGIYLILFALPFFLTYSLSIILEKMRNSDYSFLNKNNTYLVSSYSISAAKIIIGFIVIRSSAKIARFFNEDVKKI